MTKTSPGCMSGLAAMTCRTVSSIAPRCTGTCGALTTRPPSAVKIAQLKSSRSFTFTLLAVLRSVMPICSAMLASWLLKISRKTGSGELRIADCGLRM